MKKMGNPILLVEDEEVMRLVLEETLGEIGFEILVAVDGQDALAALQFQHKTLRGLITDINLGAGPDGFAVARHARELRPDLPVIYMSGASGADWNAYGVPNSTLVTKPFSPDELMSALSALLKN